MIEESRDSTTRFEAINLIKSTVEQHLQPYMSGDITKKTQNEKRAPIIHNLSIKIQRTFTMTTTEIEQIACSHYIQLAAKDCEKKMGRAINPSNPEDQEQYYIFEKAIEKALNIDFTSKHLSATIPKVMILHAFEELCPDL